jgi:quinol-cytochrome oxidoreductase complex cytochrome b subunit
VIVAVPARLGALSVLIAVHFLAGFLTGSIFRVRTLLGLVIIVLIECAATAAMSGFQAGVWSLTSLVAVQMGYLGGVYARSILEKVGLLSESEPKNHIRRTQ